uniref:Uncharacterized protein n=1 Tax=Hyaloperonospora arabidopsidis (strain Emoy2) TaxID=559515 RepID=M4C035_HYAAE
MAQELRVVRVRPPWIPGLARTEKTEGRNRRQDRRRRRTGTAAEGEFDWEGEDGKEEGKLGEVVHLTRNSDAEEETAPETRQWLINNVPQGQQGRGRGNGGAPETCEIDACANSSEYQVCEEVEIHTSRTWHLRRQANRRRNRRVSVLGYRGTRGERLVSRALLQPQHGVHRGARATQSRHLDGIAKDYPNGRGGNRRLYRTHWTNMVVSVTVPSPKGRKLCGHEPALKKQEPYITAGEEEKKDDGE